MKKKLLTFMLVGSVGLSFGQQLKIGKDANASTYSSFIKNVENPTNKPEEEKPVVTLRSAENIYFEAIVNLKRSSDGISEIIGNSKSDPKSTFFLETDESGNVSGKYISVAEKVAYSYTTDKLSGKLIVKEEDIHKLVCVDYEAAPIPDEEKNKQYPLKADRPQPKFSSLPSAEAVVYLDFDGEVVTSRWNSGRTINAQSYNYSDKEIEDQWEIIAEDYRPYNVNVTTDRAAYDGAPKSKRMMCIITPTNDAAPGSGGVAYIGSFSDGRDDPCWVFNKGNKTGGETCSHEVGHTVSLQHDGQSGGTTYYMGHGVWAPIMGASYRREVGHWSKGEYPQANQRQDDLQTMTQHFPYLPDDIGNDMGSAQDLVVEANGEVSAEKNKGLIGKTEDIDMFKIVAGSGDLQLKIEPFYRYPNLNVKARLLDESGKEIAVSDPADNVMSAEINEKIEAGTYYLEVDGVGEGDLQTGYGDYNSMGGFTISGTAPGGKNLPVAAFSSDKQATCSGQKIQFTDESTGDPTEWDWKFENGTPSSSSEQNPSVTYNKSGKHKVELTVTNADGSNTKTEEEYITITESKKIPVKESFESSFPPADWNVDNPDSDITWEKSEETGVDSKSCLVINNANYKKVGEKDVLMIPEMDLTVSAEVPVLTFYVAYTMFNEKSEDKLKVYVSDDCGESWDEVYSKTKEKLQTKEVDFDESQDWIPEAFEDWRFEVINLKDYKNTKSLQVKFENTNGYGNIIWIDNINIDYSLGTAKIDGIINDLKIAPNPFNNQVNVQFNLTEKENLKIELRNILGETVYQKNLNNFSGQFNKTVDLSGFSKGVYLFNISNSKTSVSRKVIKN